jgi:hypothetical protein
MVITLANRAAAIRQSIIKEELHKNEAAITPQINQPAQNYAATRDCEKESPPAKQGALAQFLDKELVPSCDEQKLNNWVQQLKLEQLPKEPFEISPGVNVVNKAVFLSTLKQEITLEPKNYRMQAGVLQEDILKLKKLISHNAITTQTNNN